VLAQRMSHRQFSVWRGTHMKYGSALLLSLVLLFLSLLLPFPLAAQSDNGNDAVALGRRLFQQNCSVCHTQATLTNPMYGPSLYRDIVNGKEEFVRDYISKGSNKMPGFRYGLKASEINAIVEYLKTVPKPAQRAQVKGEGPVD
jgi:mono/diheme cytochrome c family protein